MVGSAPHTIGTPVGLDAAQGQVPNQQQQQQNVQQNNHQPQQPQNGGYGSNNGGYGNNNGGYGGGGGPPQGGYGNQAPQQGGYGGGNYNNTGGQQQQQQQYGGGYGGGGGAAQSSGYAQGQEMAPRYQGSGAIVRNDGPVRMTLLEALNPYQNRWTIKVRVNTKSERRRFTNQRGDGQLFSFDIQDEARRPRRPQLCLMRETIRVLPARPSLDMWLSPLASRCRAYSSSRARCSGGHRNEVHVLRRRRGQVLRRCAAAESISHRERTAQGGQQGAWAFAERRNTFHVALKRKSVMLQTCFAAL